MLKIRPLMPARECSAVVQGCMRIASLDASGLDRLISADLDGGINFFDHADIYGGGECERVFGEYMHAHPGLRNRIIIQSKCGIKPGVSYDFSREHIIRSVEQSLSRLRTDHLDFLLLHRPDTLMEPCEVGEAFDILHSSGKVLYFGVSNQNPYQMKLLSSGLGDNKILINQLQLSLTNCSIIDAGINVNTESPSGVDRDGSVLEYCRLHGITIQPWSPFQHGFFGGSFIDSPDYPVLNDKLREMADRYGVTREGLAIAWILRHPANMQPVVGTTNPERIRGICAASEVRLSHDDWYELYRAAGHRLP